MNSLRRQILGLLVVFLTIDIAYADMMSVSRLNSERKPLQRVIDETEIQHTSLFDLYDLFLFDHFDLGTIQFLPKATPDLSHPLEAPYVIELTDGSDSCSLCLYALISLGLCSAPHWIRRLSLGHIPEWYHDGGPFQIGHRFAVSPESPCPVPAHCFVHPDTTTKDSLTHFHKTIVVPSWQKPQFTSNALASRGPPS